MTRTNHKQRLMETKAIVYFLYCSNRKQMMICYYCYYCYYLLLLLLVWLGGVVVSALGMRTWRPWFESRVAPLFHWVATLGKLFTHIAFPVSQLQETGVQKEVFGA